MKKVLLGLSILSGLFLGSCSKDENVAKEYTYTMDEEFVDNQRGWLEDTSTYVPDALKPDSILTAYTFSQISADNGLLSLKNDSSTVGKSSYLDAKEANLGSNDFIIETAITWVEQGDSKRFAGLTWDHLDEDNYKFFGVTIEGNYIGYDVINGDSDSLIVEAATLLSLPTLPVYNLKVQRSEENIFFSINGTILDTLPAAELSSSQVGLYSDAKNDINFHYLRAQQ